MLDPKAVSHLPNVCALQDIITFHSILVNFLESTREKCVPDVSAILYSEHSVNTKYYIHWTRCSENVISHVRKMCYSPDNVTDTSDQTH